MFIIVDVVEGRTSSYTEQHLQTSASISCSNYLHQPWQQNTLFTLVLHTKYYKLFHLNITIKYSESRNWTKPVKKQIRRNCNSADRTVSKEESASTLNKHSQSFKASTTKEIPSRYFFAENYFKICCLSFLQF